MNRLIFLIIMVVPLCSCISTPPPEWIGDINAVYPSNSFIAQAGYGKTREAAQASAMGAISRYFTSEVTSRIANRQTYAAQDDAYSRNIQLEEVTLVESAAKLFAVRYSEPWFDKTQKEWQTVGYINREEAWEIFLPGLTQKAAAFQALFDAADASSDPLQQVFRYSAALDTGAELTTMLDFARLLHPTEAQHFDAGRNAAALLPARLRDACARSSIYVDCPVDYDGAVTAGVTKALSAVGFPVAQKRAGAAGVCAVRVEEGMAELAAGTFYTPKVTVTLNGTVGQLFTWASSLEQVGARSPTVAKQRAYEGLAAEIGTNFLVSIQGELK